MSTLATVLALFVAAQHLGFLVLEMFLWRTPFGRKTFKMSAEQAEATAVLAMNQGLYNGFLAAGLVFGVVTGGGALITFFLACVLVAGVFGGLTASRGILFIQALPAALALAARLLA